ncbi:hypothetical protein ACVGVM_21540 [Pseudonocardia bannensis]|uniref:Uncharacterized protein n=1 Tax=Pseudonocardia bannensis TaxID=630973 RepID=A0A848DH23_9PSEU|nr:hypothetical protein [Pseudonocardia bannensis]NMH91833.1 hypothetical protein [Pseudonocardia bannensis]
MSREIEKRLRMLADDYAEALNRAVAEGREDLVEQLAAEYPDAALRVLTEAA